MLAAILISADANTGRRVCDEVRTCLGIETVRLVSHYPSEEELRRLLHVHTPGVIFIHCRFLETAMTCASLIGREAPGTLVIGVDYPPNPDTVLRLVRSGVRELLPLPTTTPEALETIENIRKLLGHVKPEYPQAGSVYCFVPAKPGVGASTIAANTALTAAGPNRRVLLCDVDANVGMSAFLLRTPAQNSIRAAVEHAWKLDEDIWSQLVFSRNELDVLGPGVLGPGAELDPEAVAEVLRFATRIYDHVFIDCSGNLEPFSVELMKFAKNIFLVCTQEVAALHLGRIKVEAMRTIDVKDRVSVLLNRSENGHLLSIKEIEKLLESRVRFSFCDDRKRVNESAMGDGMVDSRSDLGKQFSEFAASIAGGPGASAKPAGRRRFLEFFSVTPASYSLQRGQN